MADSIEMIAAEMMDDARTGPIFGWGLRLGKYATRLRALSPAGGDWVMVPRKITEAMCDACHDVPHGFAGSPPHPQHIWDAMLAASHQQEPGATAAPQPQANLIGYEDGSSHGRTTPPAHGDGEGERTLKQVGWMRFKNGGAEISTAQECPPDRSAGNASHWFAIHAYEARRNV